MINKRECKLLTYIPARGLETRRRAQDHSALARANDLDLNNVLSIRVPDTAYSANIQEESLPS